MRTPTEYHRDRLAALGPLLHADARWLAARVDAATERACRDLDPERFFPPDGARFRLSALEVERDRVERLCAGCPVRGECLAGALLRGEIYGSWGGVAQPDYQTLYQLWRSTVARQPATGQPDRQRGAA
jgi:hypothetical protein